MTIPWVEKYRPKKVSEVIGNKEAIQKFLEWINSWEKGKPIKKAALLYGPPGVGKTSLVLAYALEKNYDIIEMNASDWRNASKMNEVAGVASQQSTLLGSNKRIIVIDEVDGIAGKEDIGGLSVLNKIVSETRVPIVLIANDAWQPRLAPLREKSELIEFKKVHKASIVSLLKKICEMEKIKYDEEVLKNIAERSTGDVRSAINDLQAIGEGKEEINNEDLIALGYRDRLKQVFDSLVLVFHGKSLNEASKATINLDIDPETFFIWILDNAIIRIKDTKILEKVLNYLAKADLYFARISKKQEWSYMKYAIPLMTGGVAISTKDYKGGFIKFSFPQKIRLLNSIKDYVDKKNAISKKIVAKCHTSSYTASKDILPFIKIIFLNNEEATKKISKFFNFEKEEIDFIKNEL
ncbi:MAG: replication factor C large subunit [Nitrososphaerota archaeon]